MFHGSYNTTMDEKGRTSFPAHFREVLKAKSEDCLMITQTFKDSLLLQPYSVWASWGEELTNIKGIHPQNRIERMKAAALTKMCTVDKQGRVLIPPELRKRAKLNKSVTWIGLFDHIELWDTEKWNQMADALLNDNHEALGSNDK